MGQRWEHLVLGTEGLGALCTHRQFSDDALMQMGKKIRLCLPKKGDKNVVGLHCGKVSSYLLLGGPAGSIFLEDSVGTPIKMLEVSPCFDTAVSNGLGGKNSKG